MTIETGKEIGGIRAVVIVRDEVQERLSTRCFSAFGGHLAGSFSAWRDARELFEDPIVVDDLVFDAAKAFALKEMKNSVQIELAAPVGWEGTDNVRKYHPADLEFHQPNRRSCVLRVKLDRKHLLAPRTNLLTIVYDLKPEPDNEQIAILVWSIYPGKDIGELDGDITEREKVVFFGWGHPGVQDKS